MWTTNHVYNMSLAASHRADLQQETGGVVMVHAVRDSGQSGMTLCMSLAEARDLEEQLGAALEEAARASIAVPVMFPHPSAKGAPAVELVAPEPCKRCADHDPRDRRDHGHLPAEMWDR